MRWWLVALAMLPAPFLSAQDSPPPAGTLEVSVSGIRPGQGGVLLVALYQGRAGWLELDSAVRVERVPVSADSMTVVFEGLPPDSGWAIAVTHDKNGNDKMDMRWFPFPKPKEGAGVSGNNVRMGKPKYDEARFTLAGGRESQHIVLRY